METRFNTITLAVVFAVSASLWCGVVPSASGEVFELGELEEELLSKSRESGFKFRSVPLTQISPAFKTVVGAIAVDHIDTTVTPPALKGYASNYSETRILDIEGYNVAPYLALSLRNFGVGIAGEVGQRKVNYVDASSFTDNGSGEYSYSNYREEQSQLNYSGVGIYLYANLTPSWKKFVIHATLGTKSLNGKHQAKSASTYVDAEGNSNSSSQGGSTGDWEGLKYTVTKTEFGLNAKWKIGRHISLIPWAHYMKVNTSQIDDLLEVCSTEEYNHACTVTHGARYHSDVQLFWHDRNPMYTGLDFALKFGRLEFHLGGAVGALISLVFPDDVSDEDTAPIVEDTNNVSISASYEFKTR